MHSIKFSCAETFNISAEEIAQQILDIANWPDFQGYGVLPGIKSAEFEVRTPQIVGSKIRVQNSDGSSHVEEIMQWDPPRRLRLNMQQFSPPLGLLASAIDETWEFERSGDATKVVRSLEMHAKSPLAIPILWLISLLLRQAIKRHLRQMRVAPRSA